MHAPIANFDNFPFKTQPDKHQREFLERTALETYHACHWEQGLGKTKVIIDNFAYLYLKSEIDAALIVAPNGVDLNWLIDELPKHLSDAIVGQTRTLRFSTQKSSTAGHKAAVKHLLQHHGLSILIMSYDAWMTHNGKQAAIKLLDTRRVFYVLDESSRIKTPGAKRTKRITLTAHRAKYRRTLTGTPMPNGAFDIYKQIEFLNPDFWPEHNFASYTMFKNYFGVYAEKPSTFRTTEGKSYEVNLLQGFQHLEELNKIIAPISSRLLKQDVLNLPPKIYQPRYFDLAPEQRRLYDQLREEYLLWLDDGNTLITANLAIVRLLRLQQISCGYIPTPPEQTSPDSEPVHIIPGPNARLNLLEEVIEDNNDKTIIWARYKLDIQLITDLLKRKANQFKFVTYTGQTNDKDRIKAKHDFQNDPNTRFFVATPSAASEGLTLHAAKNVIYYSNSFNLKDRLQSEDRAHRRGLEHPVNYIDLLGNDSIDKPMMLNLIKKMNTSDAVLGDIAGNDIRSQLGSWLAQ